MANSRRTRLYSKRWPTQKWDRPDPWTGQANHLILPDLDTVNIGSKLVQRLAGAHYGFIPQGFALPVGDLSRGAAVEDILGAALMVAARST